MNADIITSTESTKTGTTCAYCGCALPSGRSHFCSDKCKNAWKHYRMSKSEVDARRTQTCLWCGKKFTHKFVGMRFCSTACHKNFDNHGGKSQAEVKEANARTCPICGKTYVAFNSVQIYCSLKCRDVARNIPKTYTPDDAKTGCQDPYAALMQAKAQQEADREREFESVTRLPDVIKRTVVASWPEEKRNALRTFYIRKFELSSGKILRSFGKETEKTDAQKAEDGMVSVIRSTFDRQTVDEDNMGFDPS